MRSQVELDWLEEGVRSLTLQPNRALFIFPNWISASREGSRPFISLAARFQFVSERWIHRKENRRDEYMRDYSSMLNPSFISFVFSLFGMDNAFKQMYL